MAISNPYVVDRPLAEGDAFVGRYKLLSEAAHRVRRGRRLILIYGADQAGKTSFLRQLRKELSPEFLCEHLDFVWPQPEGRSRPDPEDIAAQALTALQTTLGSRLASRLGVLDNWSAAGQDSESGLAMVLGALQGRTAVVLLDGLSLGEMRGEAGQAFLVSCQDWLGSVPDLCLVIALNGMQEGASMFSPALTSLPSVQLVSFSQEETEELLLKAAAGGLLYEYSAIRRIWELTSGQPYFVQLLGYLLYNSRVGRMRVRAADVDKLVPEAIRLSNPLLERIWSAFEPLPQAVLVLTNELKGCHGVFSFRDLVDVAASQSVSLSDAVIEAAVREWQARGVVCGLSQDSYAFSVELARRWLAEHKPTAETLVELKLRKRLDIPRGSRPQRRYWHWSTVGLEMAGLLLIAAVMVLWNLRGSGKRITMGASPTATPALLATRATLVAAPSPGRVAYMAKDEPDAAWDIWVMREDGSDPQKLTDHPVDDMSPTWSPDGESIAFVSERDGNREIYLMRADGTQPVNLTHHAAEDWSPAWSPDGASIAFSSYRDGNWELYVMGADGSDPTRLTVNDAADYGASWSPDGRWIAFHTNRDDNWEIYLLSMEGEDLRRLTEDAATDFAPAWSPDGSEIAFESYRDGNMEIYVIAVESGEWRNVTNEVYSNEHGPAWALHGKRLVYFSNRDGGWDLFSINPDGAQKSNLTLSTALEQGPAWHD